MGKPKLKVAGKAEPVSAVLHTDSGEPLWVFGADEWLAPVEVPVGRFGDTRTYIFHLPASLPCKEVKGFLSQTMGAERASSDGSGAIETLEGDRSRPHQYLLSRLSGISGCLWPPGSDQRIEPGAQVPAKTAEAQRGYFRGIRWSSLFWQAWQQTFDGLLPLDPRPEDYAGGGSVQRIARKAFSRQTGEVERISMAWRFKEGTKQDYDDFSAAQSDRRKGPARWQSVNWDVIARLGCSLVESVEGACTPGGEPCTAENADDWRNADFLFLPTVYWLLQRHWNPPLL